MERTKLKQFRVGKKQTQGEFAEGIGYSRGYYRRVESGEYGGSLKFWQKIGEVHGVPMVDVLELMKVDES